MAADKKKAAKGKRAIRGKLPSKTTINLVLIDENKISLKKAIPGVLIIILLAALFSKYLVADRLVAMTASGGRAARLKTDLNTAMQAIDKFGNVETTYAHYTYAGMTKAELDLVDRAQILGLVESILPHEGGASSLAGLGESVGKLFQRYKNSNGRMSITYLNKALLSQAREAFPSQYAISAWSVSGNVLNMSVTANTLNTLNSLARTIENSDIVDSCAILTSRKEKLLELGGLVEANLTVYLQKAPEEASAS